MMPRRWRAKAVNLRHCLAAEVAKHRPLHLPALTWPEFELSPPFTNRTVRDDLDHSYSHLLHDRILSYLNLIGEDADAELHELRSEAQPTGSWID